MTRMPRVLIVGAGLGGLAAARALKAQGIEVTVAEQADQVAEVGAGINMSPNAVKVLRNLGVEKEALAIGFMPTEHVFRDWRSGGVLSRMQISPQYEQMFGAPHLSIHRSDLHQILLAGVSDQELQLGMQCLGVEQRNGVAAARFSGGRELEADVIVGADGIKSAVRESLFGEDQPVFTGNVAWRMTVPTDALRQAKIDPAVTNWLGPGGHVVHYYVRRGELVNVVAVYETNAWVEETWSHRGDKSTLLQMYGKWNERLLELFSTAPQCFEWGLFDRVPLKAWTKGRVTLLGDSAHPMLPFMGQGAAMAMEDGLALAVLLKRNPEAVEETLALYERLRLPRTARAQLGSRGRARENHLRSPISRFRRNMQFRLRNLFKPNGTLHQAEWLYSYNAAEPG